MSQTNSYYLFLFFTFIPSILFSQYTITGKFVDENDLPIEFMEVSVYKGDSIIRKDVTNKEGTFNYKLPQDTYKIIANDFGITVFEKNLALAQDLDLGVTLISNNKVKLNETVVTGNKKLIERKIDRTIFNVENLPTTDGGSAVDILNITPGLIVSNDRISMAGKGSVNVMINDRILNLSGQELVSFLKGIRSSDIKNIEIITTPPAKYEAEGNSGIINIKLKKSENNTWNSNLYSTYQQGKYAQGTIGASYNYRKNKLSFFLNTSYNNGKYYGEENSKIIYPNLNWKGITKYRYQVDLINMRTGFDFDLTKNWLVGFQYIGSFNTPNFSDVNNTKVISKSNSDNKADLLTNGISSRQRQLNSINIHSIVKLDSIGRKISVDFDFFKYDANINRDYFNKTSSSISSIESREESFNNLTNQEIENYSTQVDLEHPINALSLNYGVKLSFTKTNNNVNIYDTSSGSPIVDTNQSNNFNYLENTQAAYLSGSTKFGDNKWEIQLGLRGESTITEGTSTTLNQTNKNSYFKLFPTAYLTYQPSKSNYLALEYGRRIYRPGFAELNPFRLYSTPYSYSEGNPKLKPTLTTNIELSYIYKSKFQATLFYTKNQDNSGQVIVLNNDDLTQSAVRLNYFDNYSFGSRIVYIYKNKWWINQNSANLFINHSDSKIYPITPKSINGFGGIFKTTNIFYLNNTKTISTGFDFIYRLPNKSNDLVYNYDNKQFNAFFKMLFFDKNLQLTITGNNLFKEYLFNTKSERSGNLTFVNGYYDSQHFRISLSYTFGSSKVRVKQRDTSNESERDRSN